MKTSPEAVTLSREDGDARIARLRASSLADDDQGLLIRLIRLYVWGTCALSATQIRLKRLKRALVGGGKPPPSPPTGGGSSERTPAAGVADGRASASATVPRETPVSDRPVRRQGHGRQGAAVYTGAERVVCRHETLTAGQPCPACARGTRYPLPAGVEIRVDGNALLSAVRYAVEKVRGSACDEGVTAATPATTEPEKDSPRARAVIALGWYSLGLPLYRMESYPALVGVPVAAAPLWDLAEPVADCAWPVVES